MTRREVEMTAGEDRDDKVESGDDNVVGRDDRGESAMTRREVEMTRGKAAMTTGGRFERQRKISVFSAGQRSWSRPRCHFEAKREISFSLTGALPTAGLRSLPLVEMTAGEGRDDSGGRSR